MHDSNSNLGLFKSIGVISVSSVLLAISAVILAAEPEPSTMQFTLVGFSDAAGECGMEWTVRHDQTNRALISMIGRVEFSLIDGFFRAIPMHIQFPSESSVVEVESIMRSDLPVGCAEIAIEWSIEQCTAPDQRVVQCPPIEINGQGQFRELSVVVAY
ncbi:MAG: hypothetical protein AAGH65_01090 [Pseudomonadota bacterium]